MKQSKSLVLTMSFSKPNGLKISGKSAILLACPGDLYHPVCRACSFISFASIRIAIEDQLVEISNEAVGATMAQIKPFLYCGAVYGLMSGFFDIWGLCLSHWFGFMSRFVFLDRFSNMKFFDVTAIFIPAIVLACSLGYLGAFLCVRQQLKN